MRRRDRDTLLKLHASIESRISERLAEFRDIRDHASEEELFCELVFCIMTPQSKAKSCGAALEILREHDLILRGESGQISEKINIVRFRNNKARYIVLARETFTAGGTVDVRTHLLAQGDAISMRSWLVRTIKGLGWKESSHFLRNTGFGPDVAILDRHIIRNMIRCGYLPADYAGVTPRNYAATEQRFLRMSADLGIMPAHLDFVLWYKEAGDVYK
jgi:N-glycosylase/DNA lyase